METHKPKISVIVPVYNTSKYLDKCLDSLVKQTFSDIEIICIDDASTDNSLEILREWEKKDCRIHVIESSVNKNVGGARNMGIHLANGYYIGFVDSDDFIANDMYQMLIDHSDNMTMDIVIGNHYAKYFNDNKTYHYTNIERKEVLDIQQLKREILLKGCHLWTNIFKKDLFVDNKLYFPEHLWYEDLAICAHLHLLAKAIQIVDTPKPCYYYRKDILSVSGSTDNYHYFDRIVTAKMFLNNAKRLGLYEKYIDEIEYVFYIIFYFNTIGGAFWSFTKFPTSTVRALIREFKDTGIDIKSNPYFKGEPKFYQIIKLICRFPFLHCPIKTVYSLFLKLKGK